MRLIIDRIEGNIAVCENEQKEMINIPLPDLPKNCKEGTIIEGIEGKFIINAEEQEKRQAMIKEKMDRLFE